jgi:hypothetical protein
MKACCCCSMTAIYTFRAAALGFWRCRTGPGCGIGILEV